MAKVDKKVKLTLVKSLAGRPDKHKATVRCLGLRKTHSSVVVQSACPSVSGMIKKVEYLLKVEEI